MEETGGYIGEYWYLQKPLVRTKYNLKEESIWNGKFTEEDRKFLSKYEILLQRKIAGINGSKDICSWFADRENEVYLIRLGGNGSFDESTPPNYDVLLFDGGFVFMITREEYKGDKEVGITGEYKLELAKVSTELSYFRSQGGVKLTDIIFQIMHAYNEEKFDNIEKIIYRLSNRNSNYIDYCI